MRRAGAAASQGQEQEQQEGGTGMRGEPKDKTRQSRTTHNAIIELDMIASPNQ